MVGKKDFAIVRNGVLTDEYVSGDAVSCSPRNAHAGLFWGLVFSSPAWLALFLLVSSDQVGW